MHFHSIGEHQQPHFPGLTRGLVAVLLYWDGKRCIANSLRTLIQSRQGKTWTLELRSVLGWWADQSSLLWVLLGLIRLKGIQIFSDLFVSFWDAYVFRYFVCSLTYFSLANMCFYLYGCWVQNGFSVTAWCWALPSLGKSQSLNWSVHRHQPRTLSGLQWCDT